jgi:hypothetical protein
MVPDVDRRGRRQPRQQTARIVTERALRQCNERNRGQARELTLVGDEIRQRVSGFCSAGAQAESGPCCELGARNAAGFRESTVGLLP